MTEVVPKKPQSFSDLFLEYSHMAPTNEMVRRLRNDPYAQEDVIRELVKWKQTKFINLVHEPDQAKITMSMYSGDGIVTKITPENYTSIYGTLPFVLFPFEKHTFKSGMSQDYFVLENYPMLDHRGINRESVTRMKKMLDSVGLEFNLKDDKPDNIGSFPDGTLCVLDGDAVRPKYGCDLAALKRHAETWVENVHHTYPELYLPDFIHVQTPETNYDVRPYVSREHVPVDAATPPWAQRSQTPQAYPKKHSANR